MKNDFNRVAPVYDKLAQLLFGNKLKSAQNHFLYRLKSEDSVLIIGGGSGHVLGMLDNLNRFLAVTYLEKSSTMIHMARQRGPFKNMSVDFIDSSLEDWNASRKHDVVLTSFFLDVFRKEELSLIMAQIDSLLDKGGLWFNTDFVNNKKWWQRQIIKIMYLFFKLTANLSGNRLLDFDRYFQGMGYKKEQSERFYNHMIEAAVYKKL